MSTNGNSPDRTASAPAPATTASTRTDTDWHPLFLSTLGSSGNVAAACRAADVGRRTAYDQKEANKAFSAAWDMMREFAVDNIEGKLFEVAGDGNVQAMQLVLKAYKYIYRDNHPIVQVNNYTTIDGVPAVQVFMERIEAVRDRQQAHESKELTEGNDE